MADLLIDTVVEILAEEAQDQVLLEEVQQTEILEVGIQGPAGPAGGAATATVGATVISGHSAVALDASGLLVPADCRVSAHRGAVVGLIADAHAPGTVAAIQTALTLEHSGWAWSPGPVFVSTAGGLAQVLPAGALFAQVIGFALSSTRIHVDVQTPINIA